MGAGTHYDGTRCDTLVIAACPGTGTGTGACTEYHACPLSAYWPVLQTKTSKRPSVTTMYEVEYLDELDEEEFPSVVPASHIRSGTGTHIPVLCIVARPVCLLAFMTACLLGLGM